MTISSTNRKAGPYIGNGSASSFPFSFKVFQASDLDVVRLNVSTNVETTLALTTDYTVVLNSDQDSNPGGTITLVAGALATGFNLVITSDLPNLQPTDLTNQGGFYPDVINDALDRATIQIQQLQEGLDRAALLPITSSADADSLVADIVRLADSADNLDIDANNIDAINTVAGSITNVNSVATNIANVNAVAGNATNINAVNANSANINTVAGSNTAINTVSTNIVAVNSAYTNIAAIIDAPNQAANAANSAEQAAASAASGMYSAVQDKSANYTIVAADADDLIRVTTTSGAVTITLPLIGSTGITDGFKIAIVKWTADANAVNIARSGSNTINGASSAQIGSQYSQIILVADAETNTWFASQSGLGATNINVDTFSGNGSTTAFTLTSDPSTKNNTSVFISGVYQQKSTYSLSGTTMTFSTAPPSGTANIEVAYSTPLAIGTPSDGTVTNAKLADSAVTYAKMQNVTTGKVLGRDTSGAGVVQELPISVDSSGNVGIGTTSVNTVGGGYTALNVAGSSGGSIVLKDTSGTRLSYIYGDASNRLYCTQNSAGVYLASAGTSWTSASDERFKDIIEPITDAANKVSTLRAVIGKYKTDEEGKRRSFLIAQDVQKVLPEAVDSSDPEKLGVQYTDVIPLLVAAIKELKAELDATKAEVAALKGA